jgi:hypothetical protein
MIIPDPAGVKLAARLHARGANRASWHIPEGPKKVAQPKRGLLTAKSNFAADYRF